MTYQGLVKSLVLPVGFRPPTELVHDELRATALSRADLEADVRGINDSLELIRRTRGGGWPTEPVTEEIDYVDLVWHELEFREGYSFSYAVYDTSDGYVGCCYLYPVGRRTPLTEQMLAHDVDVSWWVTPAAYDRGDYVTLYRALQRWVVESFPVVGGDEPDDVVLGDERVQDMQVAALRHAPAVLPDRRHDIAVHHREPWVGLCQHPRRGGAPATRRVVAGVTPAWAATLLAGSAAAVVKGSAPV